MVVSHSPGPEESPIELDGESRIPAEAHRPRDPFRLTVSRGRQRWDRLQDPR